MSWVTDQEFYTCPKCGAKMILMVTSAVCPNCDPILCINRPSKADMDETVRMMVKLADTYQEWIYVYNGVHGIGGTTTAVQRNCTTTYAPQIYFLRTIPMGSNPDEEDAHNTGKVCVLYMHDTDANTSRAFYLSLSELREMVNTSQFKGIPILDIIINPNTQIP